MYVSIWPCERERQKRLLGSKKTTKRTSNSTASCWTFSLFFAAFFCWFGLEGGNVFMNPEWGPKQVAKRCQGEGDWTLQLLHRIGRYITYMCYETWCDVSDGFLTGNLLIVRGWTLEQGHITCSKSCVCVLAKWAKMRRKNIFRETNFTKFFVELISWKNFIKRWYFILCWGCQNRVFFFSTFYLIVAWQLRMPACCLIICNFFCTKVEFALTGFCNSKVIHSYFRTTTTFFVPKNH